MSQSWLKNWLIPIIPRLFLIRELRKSFLQRTNKWKKTSSPKQEYLKPTWSDKAFTNTVETRTFHSVNERGDWNKVYSPYNINMTNKQFTKHFVHIKKWFLSEWNSIAKRVFIRSVFNMWSWKKKIYEYEKFTKCWMFSCTKYVRNFWN